MARPELEDRLTDSTAITLDEAVRRHVAKALVAAGGNMSRAARALGVDRRTLYRMTARFGFRMGRTGQQEAVAETARAYAERPVEIQEVDV